MDEAYDGVEYAPQDGVLELTEGFSDAEFSSQEIKPFQVAALFQEVEQMAQDFLSFQLDEALLPG